MANHDFDVRSGDIKADNAKPAWLPRVQYAMAGLFALGAVFTGISGYSVFAIVAFVIDAGIIVWMMQQPWAKAMLKRD